MSNRVAEFSRIGFQWVVTIIALLTPTGLLAADAPRRPNIVYVLADDLGFGDVKCLNPEGKIATPHLDRVAAGGMAFTDAHSSSAVCTPTRYGLLTGRYNWRSSLKSGVLGGYSRRLIEADRLTVPALLKKHGYHTACVGKWHLGMDWPLQEGGFAKDYPDGWKVDYTKPILNGPNAVGFDYYFGISASLDMPPYVFIENDHCQGVPTVEKTWIRKGPAHKDFEAADVLPALTKKAVEIIAERGPKAKEGQPFFLYVALTAPHTPILPTREWQGKSGLNDYGDFVMQVDATVGRVLDALDRAGVADGTLLFVASDNGCAPAADFPALAKKGHHPSYHFRGYKADIFDGGHRIPFLARWPGKVKPGSTYDHPVCLNDLMATCADVLGAKLPDDAGEDSVSLLPALTDTAKGPLHEAVVHHSANGSFAIRQGKWKLELCPGSGGWSPPRPGRDDVSKLPPLQLYDLEQDVGEKVNVQDKHPEVVARLTKLLEKYVADGRSTPGAAQKNTGTIDIWNGAKPPARP
jgi:arylsulfatase A-like enzyme